MPLSQIIVTSRYLKSGSARSVTKRKNYTKYIATRETVEKREQNQYDPNAATTEKQKEMLSELLSDFPEAKRYLEYEDYTAHPTVQNASELITTIIERHADVIGNRQNFVGYIAKRPGAAQRGAHGLFNDSDEPIVLNQVADEVAHHKGNVWSHVVSLRREDAIRLGYHHEPIIDRITYNLVQQELARRKSKRKATSKGITEQGKYSSKYALTELLICGECGTPYRRAVWTQTGVKRPVWRCVSRLEHGSKYCKSSPTIHEGPLHKAIVKAINEYYDCREDVARILKSNVESVLTGLGQSEIQTIEKRLKEIDAARSDLISLITSGACEEDKLDGEFAKLYEEETQLSEKLLSLKAQANTDSTTQNQIQSTLAEIENEKFELKAFDDVLIRKLIECVKVMSKTELLIIFKGGYEVRAEIEK